MKSECGYCTKWMKLGQCPRERQCQDGFHRGPSMYAAVCDQYTPNMDRVRAYEAREAEARRQQEEFRRNDVELIESMLRQCGFHL